MATAKRTAFASTGPTLKGYEEAATSVRAEGATDEADVHLFPAADGYTLMAEWTVEVPDAEPA